MDEKRIIEMYENEKYTLRHIADEFKTDHHRIKRILIKHGVKITPRKTLKKFTDEHKKNISISCKGRKTWSEGKKMNEITRRKNMVAHLKNNVEFKDIKKYENIDKLMFLNRVISRHTKFFNTTEKYIGYLDKFYFNTQFNELYDNWIIHDKNKWYMPSLDHKTSKFNGGNFKLDNLQFITWFENRAKAEMNIYEWDCFKKETDTKSSLFSNNSNKILDLNKNIGLSKIFKRKLS